MFLLGTLVNGLLIIIGTLLGRLLHRIPEGMKMTVMYAIGVIRNGVRITNGL